MKHYLLLSLLATSAISAQAQISETATDAVKNMGLGWNLGNTLDANTLRGSDIDAPSYWGQEGLDSETSWGQTFTTPELFTMMKNAGFGAIRVPITWYNHMDTNGNVDKAWMARVHEIVDYVINNNLYCIINVHHDTGAASDGNVHWLQADEKHYDKVKAKYEKLWTQIAEEFKDYGKELLFEGYNEMLDPLSSWNYASFAAPGQYKEEVAKSAYNAINKYAQSFVNTVRATGGNNETRNLIVSTYAASCGAGNWNSHLQDPLKQLNLPTDKTANHIIFEVHAYPQIVNSNGTPKTSTIVKKDIDDMINNLNTHLVSKGAPVIFGEWGSSNVDAAGASDYDLHRKEFLQFADYFVKQTKAAGIGTFYWMGLSDGLFRHFQAFNQPDLVKQLATAYHGSDFVGQYPDMQEFGQIELPGCEKELVWGNGFQVNSNIIEAMGENVKLTLVYVQNLDRDDDIQFMDGNWKKISVMVGTKTYASDFNPSQVYGQKAGTQHETTFTFNKTTFETLKKIGLIVHGNGISLKRAVLHTGSTVGIDEVLMPEESGNSEIYNILGVKVTEMKPGNIYIKNGKKVIVR